MRQSFKQRFEQSIQEARRGDDHRKMSHLKSFRDRHFSSEGMVYFFRLFHLYEDDCDGRDVYADLRVKLWALNCVKGKVSEFTVMRNEKDMSGMGVPLLNPFG